MSTNLPLRAVLFDMDGLLFDTEATLKRIWQQEAGRLGYDLHDTLYRELVGVPNVRCEQKLMEWFQNFPLEEFRRAWKRVRELERSRNPVPPKKGAAELLARLDALGVPMALATSSSREAVERNREAFPQIFRFRAMVTIEQVERPKPDPDIYHQAARLLGVSTRECAIFEDSNPGMRAAIASGGRAIMIPDLVEPDPDVRDGAFARYPSLIRAGECMDEWFDTQSLGRRA